VFWPAAFLVHGNGANAQEVAQLKVSTGVEL